MNTQRTLFGIFALFGFAGRDVALLLVKSDLSNNRSMISYALGTEVTDAESKPRAASLTTTYCIDHTDDSM
jgi:hypothetical protein